MAPSRFSAISRKYKGIIVNFSVHSQLSILQILTKDKLVSSDASTINEVRVVSCFFRFQAEIIICGNAVTQTTLKTGLISFLKKIENERVYQTATPGFQNFNKT